MNNLDSLRAFAVLSVMAHHVAHLYPGHPSLPYFHNHGGWFGVQLFFVLSGYLIMKSADRHPASAYAVHRILRIMPAYMFALFLVGGASGIVTWGRIAETPWLFLANLALIQQAVPEALSRFDALHVTWTLTIEVLWYALAPMLLLPMKKSPIKIIIPGAMLSLLWVPLANRHYFDSWFFSSTPTEAERFLFITNAFPAQLIFFLLGAGIYFQEDRLKKINPFALAGVAVLILCGWPDARQTFGEPHAITGIALSCLMLLALQAPILQIAVLGWVSKISYSLYLFHFPVILWCVHQLAWHKKIMLLPTMLLAFTVSAASYHLVEHSGMRLARWLTRDRKNPGPAAAP